MHVLCVLHVEAVYMHFLPRDSGGDGGCLLLSGRLHVRTLGSRKWAERKWVCSCPTTTNDVGKINDGRMPCVVWDPLLIARIIRRTSRIAVDLWMWKLNNDVSLPRVVVVHIIAAEVNTRVFSKTMLRVILLNWGAGFVPVRTYVKKKRRGQS